MVGFIETHSDLSTLQIQKFKLSDHDKWATFRPNVLVFFRQRNKARVWLHDKWFQEFALLIWYDRSSYLEQIIEVGAHRENDAITTWLFIKWPSTTLKSTASQFGVVVRLCTLPDSDRTPNSSQKFKVTDRSLRIGPLQLLQLRALWRARRQEISRR